MDITTDVNLNENKMSPDSLKINDDDNAIKLSNGNKESKLDYNDGSTSNTMEKKRVEFSENSNLSLIKDHSKIDNGLNGETLEEDPLVAIGTKREIKVDVIDLNEEEVKVELDNDDGKVQLKSKRKFNRGDTLPSIKKSFAKATNQASTLIKNIKPPKFKTADAAGRSNSLKLDFKNQEMEVVKNTNTIRMISAAEMKESFKNIKSSIVSKPTLIRSKTMSTNNRYMSPKQQQLHMNGDNISMTSENSIGCEINGEKFKQNMKRSPPPRPENGPIDNGGDDVISPNFSGQLNAENDSEYRTNLSDLNPTQFHHSSHYNSQTLEASPKGNKADMDNSTKINNYLDKIRAKIAEGSNRVSTMKPKTPKELVVLDRQEVYNFSLKNKSLTRRHTTLNQTNSMIQPRVARPKLQETLRFVNDPRNANTLNTKNYGLTLDRNNTIDNGLFEGMTMKISPIITSKNGAILNQTSNYFPVDHSFDIEMRGSPYYGEKLKKNLPKDMLKREAMENTNPFLEYNQNMKRTDEANKSNAKDSDVKHLEAYMKASENLQDAELRPEYLTFFTGYSTINPRKWSNRGNIRDWLELNLFKNLDNGLDYIKLPRNVKLENTIAYSLISIDAMLKNWLSKKTALPDDLDEYTTPQQQDLLHTLSYMSTMDDITDCIEASEIIRVNVSLAFLLSLDYCSRTYKEFKISSDPKNILLIGAPTNCLIVFRLTQPRKDPLSEKELIENFTDIFELLKVEKKNTLNEMISDLVACAHISLHQEMQDQAEFSLKLLKCVSPPDWTAVCMSRIGLHKLDKSQ